MNGEIFLNRPTLKRFDINYGLKSVITTETITEAIPSADSINEVAAGADS
jgi:hypothetical protein